MDEREVWSGFDAWRDSDIETVIVEAREGFVQCLAERQDERFDE
jgi:hypothetical protein